MTIHATDPFADPDEARSPVRSFRGRLASGVTVWTSPAPAGLTVASMMIVDGQPPLMMGLLDSESALFEALTASGRVCVSVLGADDQQLGDRFAGLLPSPGGPFAVGAWAETDYGPHPAGAAAVAFGELESVAPAGWSMLVSVRVVDVALSDPARPLIHYRGRYHRLAD